MIVVTSHAISSTDRDQEAEDANVTPGSTRITSLGEQEAAKDFLAGEVVCILNRVGARISPMEEHRMKLETRRWIPFGEVI